MIGLPEIITLAILFLLVAGPGAVGVAIWKYVIKPKQIPAPPNVRANDR